MNVVVKVGFRNPTFRASIFTDYSNQERQEHFRLRFQYVRELLQEQEYNAIAPEDERENGSVGHDFEEQGA